MNKIAIALLAVIVLQQSCKPKNDIPTPALYNNGIYVINEGTFPNGEGALTFKNFNDNTVTEDLYKSKSGVSAGLLPQSVNVFDNIISICVANSNKVVRNSTTDFLASPTISVSNPRYTMNLNSATYLVTDWGSGTLGSTAGVNFFDKSTNLLTKRVPVDAGAEEMVQLGNRLFVTCNGGFGKNNTVNIIDLTTKEVIAKMPVGPNPDGIVKDANSNIWILSSGQYDASFNLIAQSNLCRYNALTNVLDTVYTFHSTYATATNLKINPAGNTLFLNYDGNIHQMNITANAPSVFAKGYYYGLAIDNNGDVYASDPKDYVSKGQVKRFTADGILRDSFATAIVPSEIFIARK